MRVKMIAMDLDGTLLKDDKTIDTMTKDRLMRAKEMGIILVIATGRDKGGVEYVSETLRLEDGGNHYMAGVNGQIIYSYKDKEVTLDKVLDGQDARNVMKIAQKYRCECICCCGYDNYNLISPSLRFTKKLRSMLIGKPMDYGMNAGKRNFIRIRTSDHEITQDVNKIILTQSASHIKKYLKHIREELSDYEILRIGSGWIEVMSKGVSKGSSLLHIARMNGIEKEEILAFGDAENDLSMMYAIPHGVAMGNAMDSVKEAAWKVCDSNERSGIAKMLDACIFTK